VIIKKNVSRATRKDKRVGAFVCDNEPIIVPIFKSLVCYAVKAVTNLVLPKSSQTRQKDWIAVIFDINVKRAKISIVFSYVVGQRKVASPQISRLRDEFLIWKRTAENFLCQVVT
jgi:hypothetical protein